jgi:hypothetical protein
MLASSPLLPHHDARSLAVLPSRTVVTSFHPKSHGFEDGDWVLCLASCRTHRSISVAVSNGEVQVYDPERLQRVSTYQTRGAQQDASTSCVTDLLYHPTSAETSASPLDGPHGNDSPPLLWVTNQAGCVQLYDLRQQGQAASAQVPFSSPAWSVSVGHSGTIAAVAGSRKIHFLDVRSFSHHHYQHHGNRNQQHPAASPWLGSYRDSHSDQVSCVRFISESTLLSGGEDGLIAVFDTSRPNESEALQNMWNVGCPVRKVGIMTDGAHSASPSSALASTTVWCLTGNETLSLWKPELNAVREFPTLRQDLNARLRQQSSTEPSIDSSTVPVMEYLIDAIWDPQGGLLLAAGNARGEAAVFQLSDSDGDASQNSWTPCHLLTGGHRGVVRGLSFYSESVMLSVGEDARLCEWNRLPVASLPTTRSPVQAAAGGGPVRRQRGRPNLGPY